MCRTAAQLHCPVRQVEPEGYYRQDLKKMVADIDCAIVRRYCYAPLVELSAASWRRKVPRKVWAWIAQPAIVAASGAATAAVRSLSYYSNYLRVCLPHVCGLKADVAVKS
jgi:hypothetical protein